MRKGKIACNKQLLLFSQCLLPYMVLIVHFKHTSKCHLQFVSIWTSLKFCRLVMGSLVLATLSSATILQSNSVKRWRVKSVPF